MKSLILAIQFMTRLPLPAVAANEKDFAQAIRWFPMAGIFIGLCVAGAAWAGQRHDPWTGALAALLVWVAITGALHLDGLGDIADAADVSLAELHDRYPSKTAIIRAWSAAVDAEVLTASTALDPEDAPRDRLFDVLMRRFDALKDHRDAVAAIAGAGMRDPLMGLCLSAGLMQSMRWMLEAAGIRAAGPTNHRHHGKQARPDFVPAA